MGKSRANFAAAAALAVSVVPSGFHDTILGHLGQVVQHPELAGVFYDHVAEGGSYATSLMPGQTDPRVELDLSEPAFSAIGTITTPFGRCSATIIGATDDGRARIATAVHCFATEIMGTYRTQYVDAHGDIQVFESRISNEHAERLDYAHRVAQDYLFNSGDMIILTLEDAAPLEIPPIIYDPYFDAQPGIRISTAGYPADRDGLVLHEGCQISAQDTMIGQLGTNCILTSGQSGGAVLAYHEGSPVLIGVISGVVPEQGYSYLVTPDAPVLRENDAQWECLEVTASGLNLRSGPGTAFQNVATLPRGTMVQGDIAQNEDEGWMLVRASSPEQGIVRIGYVSAEYLRPGGICP